MRSHPIRVGPASVTRALPLGAVGWPYPTVAGRRKHPLMDPHLLGAIVQVVRLGFVIILIALLLYLSGIVR
jgi:hypothetical protein